ncbi:MAG: hypothetical protein WC581_06400 [Thermodesulfovibrionales bacterium]
MGFEIFNRKTKWRGTPSVTFTKLGRLSFNKSATEIFDKNVIENVLLLWDAEKRLIGVRPITKKDPRSYHVHMGKKGNGCGFSASTFLKHIKYDLSESRAFASNWNDSEEMFVIEIPEENLGSDKALDYKPKRRKPIENKKGE